MKDQGTWYRKWRGLLVVVLRRKSLGELLILFSLLHSLQSLSRTPLHSSLSSLPLPLPLLLALPLPLPLSFTPSLSFSPLSLAVLSPRIGPRP